MRPKGVPPDTRPTQRVLDYLIKQAPSAVSPGVVAKATKLDELGAHLVLINLTDGRFAVREYSCYRAVEEDDFFI